MATRAPTMSETASVIHEAKFTDVKGVRTRYYDLGSGEPMLLIHGAVMQGTASANTWTLNLEGLSKNFRVLAPDRLGSGMTDNPKSEGEYTFGAVVQHLSDFAQTMGLKGIHVVGQSIGAYLAMRLTLENLDNVKTLTLIDTATLAPEMGSFAERLAKVNEGRPAGLKEYIRFYWERMSYTTDQVTDEYVDSGYYMQMLPKSQELKKNWEAFGEKNWSDSLKVQKAETLQWIKEGRLQVPTLICWAANDPTATLEQGVAVFNMIREMTPRTRMWIVNHGGHFHYREYPEEFNQVLTNFIRSS